MNLFSMIKGYWLLSLGLFTITWQACSKTEIPEKEFTLVQEDDFAEASNVALELASGFEINLWAPGPLLSNAVSLSFDSKGRAYVSETSRRKSSDIDIREHPDWMTEDIGLSTLEETRTFHMDKLSSDKSHENDWLQDFTEDGIRDYRDLMVQSERIRIIEDTNEDGQADRSHIFGEDFNGLLTGVAAGVLVARGYVYLTVAPDLWKISDVDGDDLMDNKVSLSHGYGIHIAYAGHDMSGLTIGPDGKLYWSIGDMGMHTRDQSGKTWSYPHEGAVMRCNMDGSDLEVFAHGLRNPQELAFNNVGDLITVDNDGDHPGERERYVHVLEGSDSGWRIYWQYGKYADPKEQYKVWTDEHLHIPYFEGQAAYIIPPIALAPNGPCGLEYQSGQGWGEEWSDHFVASYFTGSSSTSKVEAFKLKSQGSSYQLESTKKLISGIVPTGVAFSPDGALYVNDWKDGYDKKPTGRIWKLNTSNPAYKIIQAQVRDVLQSNWNIKDNVQLKDLLSHDDLRVRLEAQFELVNRSAFNVFEQVIETRESLYAVLHAIWGLGQLGRQNQYDCAHLILPLKEDHPEIRAQAAKVLGENQIGIAHEDLIIALEDESPRVQRYALEALGKLGNAQSFDPILRYIEENDLDPYLRHTVAYALSKIPGAADQLKKLNTDPSAQVRMIAVLTLRHLKSAYITEYLIDSDTLIAMEVARAIHDDESIPEALPHLANSLNQTTCKNPIYLRRAINANLRIGDLQSVNRLKQYALNRANDNSLRKEAIYSLSYWRDPPVLDRVEGRHRPIDGHEFREAQSAIRDLLVAEEIETPDGSLLVAAIDACAELGIQDVESELVKIYRRGNNADIQISLLNTLLGWGSDHFEDVFNHAIGSRDVELRSQAYELLDSDQIPETTRLNLIKPLLNTGTIQEQQLALAALPGLQDIRETLLEWMDKLIGGQLDARLWHEVLVAAEASMDSDIKEKLNAYGSTVDSSDLVEVFRRCLQGGNPLEGKRLFYQNPTMPCVQCHVVDGAGGEAGPDLSKIGTALNREELLLSMLEPNARIAPGYGSATIILSSGDTQSGFIRKESSDQITLQDGSGNLLVFKQSDITSRQNLPSGMISAKGFLNKSELRDLVAYLASLK